MNIDVSNAPYPVKRPVFENDSMFKSARTLAKEHASWTPKSITKRGKAMADWADALRDSDGGELVRGYAAQKDCTVTGVGERRLRIDSPPGGHIFIDFEESGGIYGIEFPPEPEPESKKVSWFKGFFRGRGATRGD